MNFNIYTPNIGHPLVLSRDEKSIMLTIAGKIDPEAEFNDIFKGENFNKLKADYRLLVDKYKNDASLNEKVLELAKSYLNNFYIKYLSENSLIYELINSADFWFETAGHKNIMNVKVGEFISSKIIQSPDFYINYLYNVITGKQDIVTYISKLSYQRGNFMPSNSTEHLYKAGFRCEFNVEVRIDDNIQHFLQTEDVLVVNISTNTNTNYKTNWNAIFIRKNPIDNNNFRFLHITDLHISGRNDLIPTVLQVGLDDTQKRVLPLRYVNPNDNLRAIVKYANEEFINGKLDFIVFGGDLVDYPHDGYYDGKEYRFGYGPGAKDKFDYQTSCFKVFSDILTGQGGISSVLKVPVYTILGNHEYYQAENLLAFDLDLEIDMPSDLKALAIFTLFIPFLPCIIRAKIPQLYNPNIENKFNDLLDRHGTFNLNKAEAMVYDLWKKEGNSAKFKSAIQKLRIEGEFAQFSDEPVLGIVAAGKFIRPDPMHLYTGGYIEHINYSLNYVISVGKNQLVFNDSGEDFGFPSLAKVYKHPLAGDKTRANDCALDAHPYNRGYIEEHETLRKLAVSNSKDKGSRFLFTHAPFFNNPILAPYKKQAISYFNYGKFNKIENAPVEATLNNNGKNDHLDYDHSYHSMKLIQENANENFDVCFEGHTHSSCVKSIELLDKNHIQWGVYNEDVLKNKISIDSNRSDKQITFVNSGTIRAMHTAFSDVTVKNSSIIEIEVDKVIPNLRQTSAGGNLVQLLCAQAFDFYNIFGYKGNVLFSLYDFNKLLNRLRALDQRCTEWNIIDYFRAITRQTSQIFDMAGLSYNASDQNNSNLNIFFLKGLCNVSDNAKPEERPFYTDFAKSILRTRGGDDNGNSSQLRQNLVSMATEIEIALCHKLGWTKENGDIEKPFWYIDIPFHPQGPNAMMLCKVQRLLEAFIILWLDRFGVHNGKNERYYNNIKDTFLSTTPNVLSGKDMMDIVRRREQRILDIIDYYNQKNDNIVRLWYAHESSFLAELGHYTIDFRNSTDFSLHLKWADKLPVSALLVDLINKYEIQCKTQYTNNGLISLRKLYSESMPRLDAWVENSTLKTKSQYWEESLNLSDQQMKNNITLALTKFINQIK